jgi:hypothetical protein
MADDDGNGSSSGSSSGLLLVLFDLVVGLGLLVSRVVRACDEHLALTADQLATAADAGDGNSVLHGKHNNNEEELHQYEEGASCVALWGVVGRCGALWSVVGRCGALWGVVERCGALFLGLLLVYWWMPFCCRSTTNHPCHPPHSHAHHMSLSVAAKVLNPIRVCAMPRASFVLDCDIENAGVGIVGCKGSATGLRACCQCFGSGIVGAR